MPQNKDANDAPRKSITKARKAARFVHLWKIHMRRKIAFITLVHPYYLGLLLTVYRGSFYRRSLLLLEKQPTKDIQMKVTSDRIRVRAEQLRTQGYRLRMNMNMVRATLELNAGARTQLIDDQKGPQASSGSNVEREHHPEEEAA